jgi:hypothetical protein
MPYQRKYIGDSLQALVSPASYEAVDRAARDIASEARSVMHTAAAAATPVKSGAMRDAWIARTIRREGQRYSTGVMNPHWAAWMVSVGAQPHEIFPEHGHRAVSTPAGPRASVDSPGFRGAHMDEKAVETAEAVLPDVTTAARERWKVDAESAIEAAKNVHRVV